MASFRQLFEIRAGEWRRLLLLYALVFMLNASVVWGRAVSESLFLTRVGVRFLPYMFIADALLTIVAITVYGAFVDRLSNTFLMVAIAVLGALVLAGSRVVLELPSLGFVFSLLFLLERVLRAVIGVHAWTYIADFYDTRTAKRHYPLLGSASRTSGILAGLLVTPITLLFHVENLVVAWLGALLAAGLLALLTPRLVRVVTEPETGEGSSTGVIENMRDGFGFVISSGFLRFMAGAAVVGTILIYLLDYQTQQVFVERFSSADRLASFYGLLSVLGNVLTLPIQMFLLSRLVTRIGVGNANLIFPSLSALAYGLLAGIGSLFTAAFARVDYDTLRSAFRTPIDNLLYNAVPQAVKGRARAFINGLLLPTGGLIAGLILLAATQKRVPPEFLLVLGVITAVGYVATSLGARAQYGRSLATLLADDEMSLFRMGKAALEQADPAALRLLHWRLEESEDDDLTVFLLEILYEFEGRDALPRIQRFALERGPAVRAGATRILAEWISSPDVRDLCLDGLKHENVGVRRASAAALVKAPEATQDDSLLNAFLEMLGDPDGTVRAAVIPPLIASGDFFYLAPAVQALSSWLSDETDIQARALGLRVLAQTGSERLVRTLVRYLNDPAPLVRRQAVELVDDLAAQTPLAAVKRLGLETLRSLLTDDDETVRLAAVNGLGRFGSLEASQALLAALSDNSFEVRRQACGAMQPIPTGELEDALDSKDHHLAECAAFILASANHARAKRQVLVVMEALVTNAYRLHSQCLALEAFDSPGIDLIKSALNERVIHFLDRVFWLLSTLCDEEEAGSIRRSLQSDVAVTRANAAETLESLTTPHLSRLAAPLLEDIPLSELVQKGQEALGLETPTEWQVSQLAWPELEIDASPWDLSGLPAAQRQVMRLMLRETEMTYRELSEAVQALPEANRLSQAELDEALRVLTEEQWLTPTDEGQPDTYRISLRQKPGGAFAQAIWASLTDRNLAGLYNDDWLTAITIYALLEVGTAVPGDGEQPSLPTAKLRQALQATLERDDLSPLVQETARLGLARLDGDGRDAVEESMLTTIEKVIFLKQVPFFQAMTTDQLRVFASISEEATYEEGERIITEGERGDTLYVIINGEVAIQRRTQRMRGGEDIARLATLGPREYFAEMSIFDNQPYSADAVALTPAELLLVRQAPLMALIQNQPALALGLLKVLSIRLRQANELIAERTRAKPKQLMDLFDSLE